jgi:hypothetical protein
MAAAAAARGQAGLPASIGRQTLPESDARRSLNAGTSGAELPEPAGHIGATVRLLVAGPMADPGDAALVAESAGLLRPDALFCTGDLVAGKAAGAERYTQEMKAVRATLDPLAFPWYPCVGRAEVGAAVPALAATTSSGDPALGALYQRYIGPRYYSLDVGAVHVVVLDSEEGAGGLSEGQLAWLRSDLKRTFLQGQTRQVVVLLHRALWQEQGAANWKRAHDLLVDFNEHPIVTVEGAGGGPSSHLRGPRVVAVLAGTGVGGTGEYALDGPVDGIGYGVLGPVSGMEDGAVQIHGPASRAAGLLTLEEGDKPFTLARLALRGRTGQATLQPGDVVTAAERQLADAVRGWPTGAIDVPLEVPPGASLAGRVHVALANTLSVPVEVTVRLRAARTPARAGLIETAAAEGAWELAPAAAPVPVSAGASVQAVTLAPGGRGSVEAVLRRTGGVANLQAPVAEVVVAWHDGRGRRWEAVMPRTLIVHVAGATQPAPK